MRMAIDCPRDFHIRLTAALAARQVKHADLARRVGVGRSYITLMCSGKRKPSAPVAICLEQALGSMVWAYVMARSDVLPVTTC